MVLNRRSFLLGSLSAASLLAAPAIVRAGSLMPISTKALIAPNDMDNWNAAARIVDAHARMATEYEVNRDAIVGRGALRFIHRASGPMMAEMNLQMPWRSVELFGVERSTKLMNSAVRQGMIVKTMDLMALGYIPRIQPPRADGQPILMGYALDRVNDRDLPGHVLGAEATASFPRLALGAI